MSPEQHAPKIGWRALPLSPEAPELVAALPLEAIPIPMAALSANGQVMQVNGPWKANRLSARLPQSGADFLNWLHASKPKPKKNGSLGDRASAVLALLMGRRNEVRWALPDGRKMVLRPVEGGAIASIHVLSYKPHPLQACPAHMSFAEPEPRTARHQRQRYETIGRLAGTVAHDYNNLLTVILGNLEIAQLEPEELDSSLDAIRSAVERARSLTARLTVFARKRSGQAKQIQLRELIEEVSELLQRFLGGNIHLSTCCDPGLWTVSLDPGLLEQVLINLAINAKDAMPAGGELTISAQNVPDTGDAEHGPDRVRLLVQDTGSGIPCALQPRVFEAFFTTKERGGGSGIGLASCKDIVEECGGSICLCSETNEGTTFELLLPRNSS